MLQAGFGESKFLKWCGDVINSVLGLAKWVFRRFAVLQANIFFLKLKSILSKIDIWCWVKIGLQLNWWWWRWLVEEFLVQMCLIITYCTYYIYTRYHYHVLTHGHTIITMKRCWHINFFLFLYFFLSLFVFVFLSIGLFNLNNYRYIVALLCFACFTIYSCFAIHT